MMPFSRFFTTLLRFTSLSFPERAFEGYPCLVSSFANETDSATPEQKINP